jgi:adenylate kinase
MRQEIARKSELGLQLQINMSKGVLVPDDLVNELAVKKIASFRRQNLSGVILDGYPRTIEQAKVLSATDPKTRFIAVNIALERWVAVEKMLARVSCKNCGGSFNTADILTDGYDMPAILPDPDKCVKGKDHCKPEFIKRLVYHSFCVHNYLNLWYKFVKAESSFH